MLFETERLYVTKWKSEDLHALHELYNDAAIREPIPSRLTIEETRYIFEKQLEHYSKCSPCGRYFIVEKLSNKFIGILFFKKDSNNDIEIGYSLTKRHWKKGYATEIVKEGVNWIFESQGFSSVYAVTGSFNENSKNVLRRCGFLPKENFIKDGEELDLFDLHRKRAAFLNN